MSGSGGGDGVSGGGVRGELNCCTGCVPSHIEEDDKITDYSVKEVITRLELIMLLIFLNYACYFSD